jgi:hypothetical protein
LGLKEAEERAGQVAREVVAAGLASQEVVRKAYYEYLEIIRKDGVRGTFSQLLASRGLADREKLLALPSARPATPDSRATTPTPSRVAPPVAAPAPKAPAATPAPPPLVILTDSSLEVPPSDEKEPRGGGPDLKSTERTLADSGQGATGSSVAGLLGDDEDDAPSDVPEVPLEGALDENGEPPVGAKLGPYLVVGPLGRGGMAAVLRVKDTRSGLDLAMKVLTAGGRPGAEKRRARFRREVRAVMRLDHPNVIKIRDSGRSGPIDFLVMDLVEGEDFEKTLARNRFALGKRLDIMERVVRAVAHAHERGVIHRDLKPQNVLLDESGDPRVVDFGLAKVEDDEFSLTKTNTALGTPFYMAPEQHRNAKGIDHRSDIFSLGVMLYEVATGERPFTGETAIEVGHKVLTVDPPPPSSLKAEVPTGIDEIVAKAMEKDPAHRYQAAGILVDDLARVRAGKDVIGARGALSPLARLRRLVELNRPAVLTGLVVAAAFLLLRSRLFVVGSTVLAVALVVLALPRASRGDKTRK